MRKNLLFLAVATLSLSAYGQFNIQYNFSKPIQEQGEHIKQVHGLLFGYDIALKKSNFSIGPEIGFNMYGIKRMEKFLPFTNGYITKTYVHFTTSMNTYGAAFKFYPYEGKKARPYIALRGGALHYYSKMVIEDPEDPDGCEALEERVLLKDFTWFGSAGSGVKFHLKKHRLDIDFGVFYTIAGEAEFLKMEHAHQPTNNPKAKPYTAQFRHIPTGEIHEHAIGTVYSTRGSMIDFKLGVSIPIGMNK